jgi:branched-chain amino acid transport system substrate-binding protein
VEKRAYTFKSHFTDVEIISSLIKFWRLRGITNIAMLSDNTGFGTSARDELKKQAPEKGIKVVAWEEFDLDAKDLTAQLTRVRAANPEAILCWTVSPACVVFLKNAKQLGIRSTLMFGWGSVDERYMKLAGRAAEGVILVMHRFLVAKQLPDDDPVKAVILKYQKEHKERFGVYPNIYGAEAYDGMLLAFEAFRKAKSFEGPRLREALESIRDLKGVGGVYKAFSPKKHYALTDEDVCIFEWSAGDWRLLMPPGYKEKD